MKGRNPHPGIENDDHVTVSHPHFSFRDPLRTNFVDEALDMIFGIARRTECADFGLNLIECASSALQTVGAKRLAKKLANVAALLARHFFNLRGQILGKADGEDSGCPEARSTHNGSMT